MGCFCTEDVRRLLHNKYVAVLGDSIQRSVYKDLVKVLQDDHYLSDNQLRKKGERSFANDTLVEGGSLNEMHNRVTYREVRQYRTGHHLVRFYFLTRTYSEYLESVLADFKNGPQPDVLIMNSCIWDLVRYEYQPLETYKTNLDRLFRRLTEVLSPDCLVIWNMTMPVGFKPDEIKEHMKPNLRWDVIQANFFSATLANFYKMDVVDMHYHFRFDLRFRCKDAIHWNQLAHRKYTQILLAHIAQAWGVEPPEVPKVNDHPVQYDPHHVVSLRNVPHPHPHFPEDDQRGFGPPGQGSPPPDFLLRNGPHSYPQYIDEENGQHFFGPPGQGSPPPGFLMRNVPHPHQQYIDQENGSNYFGPPGQGSSPPDFPMRNIHHSHPQYNDQDNGQNYFGPPGQGSSPPDFPMRNVYHSHPQYNDQENGQHYFGPPIESSPPSAFPFRNGPHPPPRFNDQENGQHHFEPLYLHGYTSFEVTDRREMIETLIRGPVNFTGNQMGANAFSPFVEDSPLVVGNFQTRNVEFDGCRTITGINVTVPIFDDHPFSGMAISPCNVTVPQMQFGTFQFNTSMSQETWSGHPRFPRRRDMRHIHPYQRPPPFPTRI